MAKEVLDHFVTCASMPFSASKFLEPYEDEFLDVVDAKQNLLKLKYKKVISDNVKTKIEDATEEDAKYILLEHLQRNATLVTLRVYCDVAIAADGYAQMQELGKKMKAALPGEDKTFGRCLVTCVCLAVLIPLVGVAVCLCPLPFTNDWQHWMCPSGIPWPWSWGQSDTCTEAAESHKVQPTVSEQKDDITALLKHAHERQAVAQSPVVEAARHNQLPTVRILLDGETATVDDQDEDGRTALMWASRNGHQEIVSLLVDDYNANVFQRDEDGFNALHVAAQGGHWEVIKLLHRKFGARVHDGDNNNDTMLHWAAFSGHCGVARYLIEEFGMDPQDRDKWGATALLSAAFGGSALVGKMLLEEFGSSIDEEAYDNCHGWNALHFAAGACHLEMVKYLLPLFGEKKFKQDNDGRTCLDLAINAKCREVVAYLLQEGGFANHLN